jgi:hypothetical protein
MTTKNNSLPKLLDTLRPSLNDVAEWAGVSRGLAEFWRQGLYQPKPEARRRLVKAVKKQAERLLKLAADVEEQGEKRDIARERFTGWGPDTLQIAPKARARKSGNRGRRGTYRNRAG